MAALRIESDDMKNLSAMNQAAYPVKDWKWPSDVELQAYFDDVNESNRSPLNADDFCENGSLGLFMFMRYCREQGLWPTVLSEFIEDVATFRACESHETAVKLAKKIESNYLIDGSKGNTDENKKRLNNIKRQLLVYKDNDMKFCASNLSETVPTGSESDSVRSSCASPYSTNETLSLSPQNPSFNINNDKNAIKVNGELINEVRKILEHYDPTQNLNTTIKSNEIIIKNDNINHFLLKIPLNLNLRLNLFDKLDKIIFKHLKDSYYENFKSSSLWLKHHEYLCISKRKVGENDFVTSRVIGKGGFGMVNACKRCTTGKMFAIKKLHKKNVKNRKAEALCLQERKILAIIHSPYVVCLKYAFTTTTELHLVLDLMTGGDLGFYLSRKGRFSEKETKYYAARTLLGLAAMHEKNIVHRDIKPENILMDEDGYTKISDLGLASKIGKTGLSGTCGTRGYWAPEMLRRDASDKREKYTVTVDWFSFGCCIYEFMYGCSPFRTEKAHRWGNLPRIDKADRDKTINLSILEMEPDYDERIFTPILTDLISKLLIKDGKKRLGANGFHEIAAHPWFADIVWYNLEQYQPIFKPTAKDIYALNESKLGLFMDEKISKKVILTENDHKLYENWDYVSYNSFEEEVVDLLMLQEISGATKMMNSMTSCCRVS